MAMKERKTFVFVPSRTAEVIGLKGTLKWIQGEKSFYSVYYSILVLLCLPNKEISRGMWKITSDLFIPFPQLSYTFYVHECGVSPLQNFLNVKLY